MIRVNGVDILNTAQELLDPEQTAVLVIDMQNEAASEKGGYAKHGHEISRIRSIIPTMQKVLQASRRLNLPIIYTEFVHRDRRGMTLIDGPNSYLHCNEKWVSDVVDGSWEARTLDELAPQQGDLVFQKSRGSAVYKTYLDFALKNRNIRSVILMGCLTDGCILKTAVNITEHGYYPLVIKDAVNSLTAEKHDLGLRYMEIKFPIFSSDEVLAIWGAHTNALSSEVED